MLKGKTSFMATGCCGSLEIITAMHSVHNYYTSEHNSDMIFGVQVLNNR